MVEQDHSASRDAVAPQAVGATAGDILQQQRERAGLSREAVADRLNLTQSQVAALEKNDFSPFPGETFVKGHLRTYARLLKLDCDAVLRAYKGAQPRQSRSEEHTSELQSRENLVCRLLLEKKKKQPTNHAHRSSAR